MENPNPQPVVVSTIDREPLQTSSDESGPISITTLTGDALANLECLPEIKELLTEVRDLLIEFTHESNH